VGSQNVAHSRLVLVDESTGVIGNSGRAMAHTEEILPLCEQRGAAGPDNTLAGN
jgi:hypothetical protein